MGDNLQDRLTQASELCITPHAPRLAGDVKHYVYDANHRALLREAAAALAQQTPAAPSPDVQQALRARLKAAEFEAQRGRAGIDSAVRILTGIHAVIYPRIVELDDGRKFAFNSPHLHEQMQALSDRIRAIPDELAAIAAQERR